MAYVIAEPCVNTKDTACVDACPVDCIHPRKDEPDFEHQEMLYIEPDECIDCGACVPVCPVSAIFVLDDLPADWAEFFDDRRQHIQIAPEGVQILRFFEAVVLDQTLVMRQIVSHHESRRRVEPFDEQAQFIIQRGIRRPAQLVNTLFGKPLANGIEQSVGRFLIVPAFEKSKKSAAFLVLNVMPMIENRRDSPDDYAVAHGQKSLDAVSRVKGVRFVVDHLLLVVAQRRHPVRIAPVMQPREVQKEFFLPRGRNTLNFKVGHDPPGGEFKLIETLDYND
jgi:ferredoxin